MPSTRSHSSASSRPSSRSRSRSATPTPRNEAPSKPSTPKASVRPTPRSGRASAAVRAARAEAASRASSASKTSRSTSAASSRPSTHGAAAAEKAKTSTGGSKSSAVGSRRASGTSVLQPAAADNIPNDQSPLTVEEKTQWRELDAENRRLVQKLAELNNSLDRQLGKQGINVPSRPGAKPPVEAMSPSSEAAKLKHRIDVLRRTNGDMHKALKEHNAVKGSAYDMKNKHSQLVKELEALRSDNQSLENVYNNQSSKTNQDEKARQELQRMKSEHSDVLRESREATRQLKELRESEMAGLRMLLKQQDLIHEKLRFLQEESVSVGGSPSDANGSAPPPPTGKYALPASAKRRYDVAELQLLLQSLTTEESDVNKDISKLNARTNKARWKLVADRKTSELEDLRDEMKLLKEHADAKKIAY